MSFGTKTVTLFKAVCMALIAVCVFTLCMPWFSATIETKMRIGFGVFSAGIDGSYTSFWSVMLIINGILIIFLAGLAVFGLLREKNSLVLPVAAVGFLMFFMTLFQKIFIKQSELHVGVGAWLMLFLSALAFGAAVMDNLAAGKPAFSLEDFGIRGGLPKLNLGGWTCPTCGAKQGEARNFCDRCGTKKPEPPRCPACGKLAQPGESFCADCGTKL